MLTFQLLIHNLQAISIFIVTDKDCDTAVETCLVKVCQTLSIDHAHIYVASTKIWQTLLKNDYL